MSPVDYFFKAGDHAQYRGFPTARWPDEHDEFAMFDLDIEIIDGLKPSGIYFVYVILKSILAWDTPYFCKIANSIL